MKFGFEGRQHQMNYIQTDAPNGNFNFDHLGTSQCPNDLPLCGGDGMATFMMGYTDRRRRTTKSRTGPPPRTASMPGMFRTTGKSTTD